METNPPSEYCAYGGAAELLQTKNRETLFDGPAGTGKTRAVLEFFLELADNYPGCRILLARKTRASLTESVLQIFETRVAVGAPWLAGPSRAQRQSYVLPNGSEIVCCGLDNPDRLMSTQYDGGALFEATECTEDDWEKIATRMRNNAIPRGVSGGRRQMHEDGTWAEDQALERHPQTGAMVPAFWTAMVADCNPSYPRHWVKKRADDGRMGRIMSRHADNPTISQDYLDRLSRLTGHRRARLFLGQWVAAEGLIYENFDEAVNVKEREPLRWAGWKRFVIGIDEGFANPCAMHLYCLDADDRMHAASEWYHRSQLESEVVKQAKRYCGEVKSSGKGREVEAIVVDPSAAQLIAALNEAGLPVVEADNDVFGGIQIVQELLPKQPDGLPRFTCAPSCKNMVQEFSSYSWAENREGAKQDKPCKENDHAMDELRYVSNWIRAHSGSMEIVTL